jgi:prepilin peptidase CpaA
MTTALRLLPLGGFAALMIAAAIEDYRRLVIPNRLVLALIALWLPHVVGLRGAAPGAVLQSLLCGALAFAGGALLFARGFVGGGDVKLFAVAVLWAGAGALGRLAMLTALVGGVLAFLYLSPLGARLGAAGRAARGAEGLAARRRPLPYGVAIAAAALGATIPPQFG